MVALERLALLSSAELRECYILTAEEEKELIRRMEDGDARESSIAREQLILHNLRLVASIARKYAGNNNDKFADYFQEGTISLMKAAEKFKPSKKVKFSTFATILINQGLFRYIHERGNLVTLPESFRTFRKKVTKITNEHYVTNGEPLPPESIMKKMKNGRKYLRSLTSFIDHALHVRETLSLDSEGELPQSENEPRTNGREPSQEQRTIKTELEDYLHLELSKLEEEHHYILSERFGLSTGTARNLEDIGNELGITKERVRQIEREAIKKLRYRLKNVGLYEGPVNGRNIHLKRRYVMSGKKVSA